MEREDRIPDAAERVVEIRGMRKTFGPVTALNNVSITVSRGEIHGLIGENGSGKSTVSSIYCGIQPCDSGEMLFLGQPWSPASMVDALNSGVGMIVQETGTVPDITVAENLFLGETDRFRALGGKRGTRIGLISPRAMKVAAQAALDDIGAGHIRATDITGCLDLQDRKLVEIAKVVMKHPEVIVVDETTTALSQEGREILYGVMERMKRERRAVVFISHDLEEIMRRCNALTVLRDGEIIRTFRSEEFDADAIRTAMIGREMQGSYYRDDTDDTPTGEEIALEAKTVSFGSRVREFSMRAHRGEIVGIGGLSHSGMHLVGKLLFGALRPSAGEVLIGGAPMENEAFAMARGAGYVAKDRDTESLSTSASIRENVAIAGLERFCRAGFFVFPGDEARYVRKNCDKLHTKYYSIDQPVSQLSGGNKQKVVFAKWIGRESDIMILDCPTRGVDIGVKQAMYRLIYRMKREGKTVVMISEEMAELMGMSDRLLIMKDGAVTREFRRSDGFDDHEIIKYMI